MNNSVYIILVVVFVAIMLTYVSSQRNGASVWENYYAKEISRIINSAQPGDNITLEVQKATEIAKDNKVASFSEIFTFDNSKNKVCIKLSPSKKTCYAYFNQVDITNINLKLASPDKNLLTFTISEKTSK